VTDAEKETLIKKLGAMSNKAFDPRYDKENRRWFVGKIIDSLLSQKVPDADVEKKTNDVIAASSKALKSRITKGFSEGRLANRWKLYDKLTSRTQIIYGMIALHQEFLDPANADYFDFILERRFRSVQRMAFFVNPNNERNVFAYPTPPEKMKVNKHAALLWSGVRDGSLPFILTASGKADPMNAVEQLFKKNRAADRNLFACDPVATILHLDALRGAKNPDSLLKALVPVGDHYLKIDAPTGHFGNFPEGQRLVAVTSAPATAGTDVEIALGRVGPILALIQNKLSNTQLSTDAFIPFPGNLFMIVLGDLSESFLISGVNPVTKKIKLSSLKKNFAAGAKIYAIRTALPLYGTLPFHFITDSRADRALFEQISVKSADLQVGDHVYVLNHPLYLKYYPEGAWGGEHSFISEIGSRDSGASVFQTALKVEGHGLNKTLLGMGDEMLEWINTVLGILQALTRIHIDNLKTNGRKTTAKVKFITRTENNVSMNVFEYNMPYMHKLFREGRKEETITAGFVIKERASDPNVFQVFNANGKDSTRAPVVPSPDVFLAVVFTGAGASQQFEVSKWAAPYFNVHTAKFEAQPLFENNNKTPKLLTFEDLAKSKPFIVTDDIGDAFVTRPRVDFSAPYQKFLKTIGAI
jgi:hypothetical protein